MRKLLSSIAFIMACLFVVPVCYGAARWTYSTSWELSQGGVFDFGSKRTRVLKISVVADGAATAEEVKFSEMVTNAKTLEGCEGMMLYALVYDPSTTAPPDTTFDLEIQTFQNGATIWDSTASSTSAEVYLLGDEEVGHYPVLWDDTYFIFQDIGSANDAFDLYLYLLR